MHKALPHAQSTTYAWMNAHVLVQPAAAAAAACIGVRHGPMHNKPRDKTIMCTPLANHVQNTCRPTRNAHNAVSTPTYQNPLAACMQPPHKAHLSHPLPISHHLQRPPPTSAHASAITGAPACASNNTRGYLRVAHLLLHHQRQPEQEAVDGDHAALDANVHPLVQAADSPVVQDLCDRRTEGSRWVARSGQWEQGKVSDWRQRIG